MLGAAVGLVFGGVVYLLLRLRRRPAPDPAAPPDEMEIENAIETAISRAARRYLARSLPWYSCYAVMKYGLDPCYEEILRAVPPGARLADLGAGLGLLPVALALYGGGRSAAGVDWDRRKLRAGGRVMRGLAQASLAEGDLRAVAIPPCDIVALVDVLHGFEVSEQQAI